MCYCTLIVNDIYVGIIADSYINGNNDNLGITLNTGVNYLTFYCTNNTGFTGGFAMICKDYNYLFNTNELSNNDDRWFRTPMYIVSSNYDWYRFTYININVNIPLTKWVWNVPNNNIVENNVPFTYYYYYNSNNRLRIKIGIYVNGQCMLYLNDILINTIINSFRSSDIIELDLNIGVNEFKFQCINNSNTQSIAGIAIYCTDINNNFLFNTNSSSPIDPNWVYRYKYKYYCNNVDTSLLISKSYTVNTSYNTKFINFINSFNFTNWTVPKNVGYKVNGVDISNYCCAKYYDFINNYTGTLPTWVNSIKVICISGGSGGNGGNSTTSGSNGLCGKMYYSSISISTFRTFTISIGLGGVAGYGNSVASLNGTIGQPGNITTFKLGIDIISSNSGSTPITQYIQNITNITNFENNFIYGSGGNGGPSGNTNRIGTNGNNGFCRIFIFN